MNVGLKISLLIDKNKLTKKFVASQLEIARNTLDDYITERTSIPVNKLVMLSKLFKVDMKDFFEDDVKENKDEVIIKTIQEKKPKIVIQYELNEEDNDKILSIIGKRIVII